MKIIDRMKGILLLGIILCLLSGCAGNETPNGEAVSNSTTNEKVAVASWQEGDMTLKSDCRMIGDTLYFMDSDWDEEHARPVNTSICKKERDVKEEECIISLSDQEEFLYYVVDEAGNVYCLYIDHSIIPSEYSLRKVSSEGEAVYDILIMTQQEAEEKNHKLGDILMGEATEEGYVCFANGYGELYLFDTAGQLIDVGRLPWEEAAYNGSACGLVNAGESGIFVYRIENGKILLQESNCKSGELAAVREVVVDGRPATTLEIYNGYDNGILISDTNSLWSYDYEGQKIERLFGWGDSNVNLNDYVIDCVGVLQDDALYVMAHQSYEETAFVQVDYAEQTELVEKQLITLSNIENTAYFNKELEGAVSEFNRTSKNYKVEYVSYASSEDLYLDLIQGEGPDIFILGTHGVDLNVLASKGVLEDLQPYLAGSDIVQEEDLLPVVRREGTFHDELVCVFPTFMVYGLEVEKGTTREGGWTPEEYIAMAEANPEAAMADYGDPAYYQSNVLRDAIRADMGNYVDWENMVCYFDSERFIALLDRVSKLNVPVTSDLAYVGVNDVSTILDAVAEKFLKKELLTDSYVCGSIEVFDSNWVTFGDFAEIAGFPNAEGIPYYKMEPTTPLGMNSASQNKEGAWAFMEFVLSEEYQAGLDTFPVRQELFDEHIKLKETHGGLVQIDLTEEQRAFVVFMVENSYWMDASIARDFYYIISEETDALWAGDKTAEEVADIIQSRISIFLSEQAE